MKINRLLQFGSALLVSLYSLLSFAAPLAHALLEPTRIIDPHAVTRTLTSSDQAFVWTVTPKTAIPALSGSGNLGGRVVLSSGYIGFAMKQSSIVFELRNTNHSGTYDSSDYQNVDSSATTDGTGDLSTITYPFTLTNDTDYEVTIDTSTTGWFTVKFKDGISTEVTVGEFKKYTDGQDVGEVSSSPVYTNIEAFDMTGTTCTAVANTVEADLKISIDGTAQDLTASPALYTKCGSSLDVTSYETGSKTATLKQLAHNASGVVLPKTVLVGSNSIFITTSLNTLDNTTNGTATFKDLFYPIASNDIELFLQKAPNGNNDEDAYPVASAHFDLSSTDADFVSQQVVLDSNLETYVALAHNLNKVTKGGAYTLYVPYKTGDQAVGICPGAAAIGDINSQCSGIYYLTQDQTKDGVTASLATVKGKQYWRISGLTGTGAFSAATNGANVTAPDTGIKLLLSNPLVILSITTICGVLLAAIAKRDKLAKVYGRLKHFSLIITIGVISVVISGAFTYHSQPAAAWRMPYTGSILSACIENGNIFHGHIQKPANSDSIKVFSITLSGTNMGGTKSVNVEGQTSVYLEAGFGPSLTNFGIGYGNGQGQGAGAAGLISNVRACLP